MVAQREGEVLDDFRARVLESRKRLAADGSSVEGAILVCNERTDSQATATRRQIARDLIEANSGHRPSVVLAASARASSRLRQALHELAPTLAGELAPRATVRIDEELASRPRSSLASVANVA